MRICLTFFAVKNKYIKHTYFISILILSMLAFPLFSFSQSQTELLTSGNSWTVPTGVTSVTVECWGGGGGGGFSDDRGQTCGGGGGGAYAKKNAITVTSGSSITYSLGAGGSGSEGSHNGGDTWFVNSSTVLAKGGGGVSKNSTTGASGGLYTGCIGDIRYSGGNGGNGTGDGASETSGGGGGGAGSTGNGNAGGNGVDGGDAGAGGAAKTEKGGAGGNGVTSNNDGNDGNNYGGGGGGAKRGTAWTTSDKDGGDGANGLIRITYCIAPSNVSAGNDVIICNGESAQLNGSATASTVTVFSENFESYGQVDLSTSTSPWKQSDNYDNNDWEISTYCSPPEGSYAMQLYYTYEDEDFGTMYEHCEYDCGGISNIIASCTNIIDATSYTDLTLNFKWKAGGEEDYDYGTVVYSTDGTTWTDLSTKYWNSTSWTSATVDLSDLDDEEFYLGFRWQNDYNTGIDPGFCIDDIKITGVSTLTYSWFPSTGLSASNISNPTATPTVTTTYTMTATVDGCPASNDMTVAVNTLSTAPTTVSGTGTICTGGSATLVTSGGSLGSDATNVWYTGGCGTDAYNQPWTTQPFGVGSTTVNSVSGGILNVTSTGNDPMIYMGSLGSFDPSIYKYIHIRYRVTTGTASNVEIFFYNTTHDHAVGGETGYGSLICDNAWHVLSIDMSVDPDYTTGGNILGWRYDWATASDVTMDLDYIALSDQPLVDDGSSITFNPSTTTTYYTSIRGACNTTDCANGTVTVVNDPSITTQPTGGTICSGGSKTLTVAASGGSPSLTYLWYRNGSSTGVTTTSYNATLAGSYYCCVAASGSGCNTVQTNTVTVTVVPDPSITTQPVGGTICSGGSLNLSLVASGGTPSLTYQWYNSDGAISSAISPSYSANVASDYYCVVNASGSGCGTATSSTVTVTVVADPAISASGSTTICSAGSASLTSSVSGGTGTQTYQWQSSSNNSTWSNITGATGSTYNPSGITSTTYYRVLRYATGSGCDNATSITVTVTVVADPTITTQPVGASICYGGTHAMSVEATGGTPSLTYQWQSSSDNSAWTDISGATYTSYTTGSLTNTTYYHVLVNASGSGCGTATSSSVLVTVSAAIQPGVISSVQDICSGGTPSELTGTSPSGGLGTYTYQWQQDPDCTGSWTDISGATSANYQPDDLTASTCYRREVSNTCGTAYSTPTTASTDLVLHYTFDDVQEPTTNIHNYSTNYRCWSSAGNACSLVSLVSDNGFDMSGTCTVPGGKAYVYPEFNTTNEHHTFSCVVTNNDSRDVAVGLWIRDGHNGAYLASITDFIIPANSTLKISNTTTTPVSLDLVTAAIYPKTNATDGFIDIEVRDIQLEAKDHATPFTPGTRSTSIVTDYSSNGNNGTIETTTSPAWTADGIDGGAYEFDGVDDYVNVSSITSLNGATEFSISFWANLNSAKGYVFWKDGQFLLEAQSAQKYRLRMNLDGTWRSSYTLDYPLNTWHNVVLTWDGTNTKMYLNGVIQVSSDADNACTAMSSSSSSLKIGKRDSNYSYLDGHLDDIRIYNQALSESEIFDLYNNTKSLKVTVVDDPTITTDPVGASICYGGTHAMSVVATGGTPSLTYQWQSSPDNSTWTDISGATFTSYTTGNLTNDTYYRVLVNASGSGCGTATSASVLVTVYSALAAGSISSNQTICYNTSPATLIGTDPTGGDGTYSYQWQSSTNCTGTWTNISGATASDYSPGSLTETTYYRREVNNTCATSYSTPVTVTSDLLLHYTFDDNQEPIVIDFSGNNNDGTIAIATSPTWTENGIIGGAYDFDGSNDYVESTNNFTEGVTALTISSWFKKNGNGSTYECVLHKALNYTIGASEYWMGLDASDYITATIGANDVGWAAGKTNVIANVGEWYNVVASWDGSIVKVYINGVYNKQYNLTSYTNIPTASTRLGSSTDGANYQFNGTIDDVRIYSKALTAAEIEELYNSYSLVVTVQLTPTSGAIASDQTICSGGDPTEFTSTAGTGSGTISYYWESSVCPFTSWSIVAGANGETYNSPSGLTETTQYRRITISTLDENSCESEPTEPVQVTVVADPVAPTATKSPNVATVCEGQTLTLVSPVSGSGGTGSCGYEYQYSTDGSIWSAWSTSVSSFAAILSRNYIRIRRNCDGSGCDPSNYNEYSWFVDDASVAGTVSANLSIPICAGKSVELSLCAYTGSIQWQTNASGSWVNISGATSDTYTTSELPMTTSYRAVVTSGVCNSSNSNIIVVTVTTPITDGLSGNDYIWTGAIDQTWDGGTTNNWLKFIGTTNFEIPTNVPDENDNVFIRTNESCFSTIPVVTTVNVAKCNNLTIDSDCSLEISLSGNLKINGCLANSGTFTVSDALPVTPIEIKGNWNNFGTFNAGSGTVNFIGTSTQTIFSNEDSFYDISFNNSQSSDADIVLSDNLTVTHSAKFTKGIVNTGSNKFIFGNSATTNDGSITSFVDGVVEKSNCTNAFTFPTGDVNIDRDISSGTKYYRIWAPFIANPKSSTSIDVKYLFSNENLNQWWYHEWTHESPLTHTSDREYWVVNSSKDLQATLYWKNNYPCSIHDFCEPEPVFNSEDLTVAYWEGIWKDAGGSASSDYQNGSITSTVYIPFGAKCEKQITFGGKDTEIPLPVELLNFYAVCDNKLAEISWSTASETNNDYFILEKSNNIDDFFEIARINGAGNSNEIHNYNYIDDSLFVGDNYYRLKQVDIDGRVTIYNVIELNCDNKINITPVMYAYPNPFTDEIYVIIDNMQEVDFVIEIIDNLGKIAYSQKCTSNGTQFKTTLKLGNLCPAVYNLRSRSADNVLNVRVVKK